jgi:hypothetical protein
MQNEEKKSTTKESIKTIVIDTLTANQSEEVITAMKGKMTQAQWKDFGVPIVDYVIQLKALGFETVLILGAPGTGKTFGMKTLPQDTNIWHNFDNRNLTWKGGLTEYGNINNPTKKMLIPKSYKESLDHITKLKEKGYLAPNPVAFLLGHLEYYKGSEGVIKSRLKTLGQLANKFDIEGNFNVVLYTEVIINDAGKPEYKLRTTNSSNNTIRSYYEMFTEDEEIIPNDYKLIYDKLQSYIAN